MVLNLNGNWSREDVKELIRSVDDDRNWRMVIDKTGNVYFVDVDKNPNFDYENMHAYYETLLQGNDYVGENAAADEKYIDGNAKSFKENWPTLKYGKFIDS